MLKYGFALCCLLAMAEAMVFIEPSVSKNEDSSYRFLATTKTTTVYVVTSTVAVSSVTRTCASTSNVTGTCRRRRGIEEQPLLLALDDDINLEDVAPSKPEPIEVSAAPELPNDPAPAVAEAVPDNKDKVESSKDLVTVDVVGLPLSDQQERLFGNLITIVYTTTSTLTSTSYVSATVATKTYVVVGCTPSGFSTSLC